MNDFEASQARCAARQRVADLLVASGHPLKRDAAERLGIFTFWSHKAAVKASTTLNFGGWTVRVPIKSIDYSKASKGRTVVREDLLTVYRIYISPKD